MSDAGLSDAVIGSPPDQPIPAGVRRAAVEWLLELQADPGGDTRARWQQWLDADPRHPLAWQRVEAFSDRLHGLSSPLAHAALAPAASPRRRQVVKALAVLLFAGGTAWLVEERVPWRQWSADRRIGTGERASFALDDGTRVELNADTAIDVRFSGSERLVRLIGGEILITTAPDPAARPFVVETAHGRIRALGTRFNVRQRGGAESAVAVFEGAVEISSGNGGVRVLGVGEQTSFTRDGIRDVETLRESAAAWSRGMIIARDMPLADFLAELGHHRTGSLGCDPAIAQLKVTGTYPLADTDKVLDMLQATLPVEVRGLTRYWVRLYSRGDNRA